MKFNFMPLLINVCFLIKRPSAPCGAGKNYITITAKGEIYPCHHFYYNDPEKTTKIGDVWNGIDEQPERFLLILMMLI